MNNGREVVVLSGVRTAIGDYGGALKDVAPTELAAQVVREAVKRARIDPQQVQQLVFGNVIHTETRDMYFSRVACIKGGLPHDTTALTVNRLCGSGLQAIVSAAQSIQLSDADVSVGGGAESMSRGAYVLPSLRWGQRMNDGGVVDMMVGALHDPFHKIHMGVTAENIAARWGIGREEQDEKGSGHGFLRGWLSLRQLSAPAAGTAGSCPWRSWAGRPRTRPSAAPCRGRSSP